MAVLVTGGAGFIGSHLIERLLLKADAPIVCLDNFNDYYDPAVKRANVRSFAHEPRVKIVEASFCDPVVVDRLFAEYRFERVVHLGAYAGVRPSVMNPLPYEENNIRGTLVLLEAARRRPVQRFVFSSSSTVYGRGAAVPFQEDQPLGIPMSPYGATKRAAELLGFGYYDLHRVPFLCLRPFSVYGPRLRPDLALCVFADAILKGKPLPLYGDGAIRRDFTHVSDICDGILAALDHDSLVGEAINLGHDHPLEIRAVIALLEKALDRKANIDRQPPSPGDMPVTCADLTKAERLLGYRPKIDFSDGIVEFAVWYRRSHGG